MYIVRYMTPAAKPAWIWIQNRQLLRRTTKSNTVTDYFCRVLFRVCSYPSAFLSCRSLSTIFSQTFEFHRAVRRLGVRGSAVTEFQAVQPQPRRAHLRSASTVRWRLTFALNANWIILRMPPTKWLVRRVKWNTDRNHANGAVRREWHLLKFMITRCDQLVAARDVVEFCSVGIGGKVRKRSCFTWRPKYTTDESSYPTLVYTVLRRLLQMRLK